MRSFVVRDFIPQIRLLFVQPIEIRKLQNSTGQTSRSISQLLDQNGEIPDIDEYARDVINDRINQYVTGDEVEPYWEEEREALHELAELRV